MSSTVRVKIREVSINKDVDSSKRQFIIDEVNGRLHGLKVNRSDGEYDLYVFIQDKNYKDRFRYEAYVSQYFKSNKHENMLFVSNHVLTAGDSQFIRLSDQSLVEKVDAMNPDGSIKQGYITEAMFFESFLGDPIADAIEIGVRRKFSLPK